MPSSLLYFPKENCFSRVFLVMSSACVLFGNFLILCVKFDKVENSLSESVFDLFFLQLCFLSGSIIQLVIRLTGKEAVTLIIVWRKRTMKTKQSVLIVGLRVCYKNIDIRMRYYKGNVEILMTSSYNS